MFQVREQLYVLIYWLMVNVSDKHIMPLTLWLYVLG